MATSPVLDYALAVADLGLKVFPIVPLGKTPIEKGWQEQATTDTTTITRWFAERPGLNYGIPTGLENGIIVVDLDGPSPTRWFDTTGISRGAVVTTPSGADRNHHYYRIDDVEIPNSQSKIYAGVDIRGEGGYVVGPGSMRPTGSYQGDIRNIPDAPQELLDIIPERQEFVYEPYEGPAVEEATPDEERQLAAIVRALQSLPAVWAPGAGWHDIVYRSSCWLSRMVNSGAYALNEDQARAIMHENTPTYPGWGPEQIEIQWNSARLSTVGQLAETPKVAMPPLLDVVDVLNRLPEYTTGGEVFMDLITGAVEKSTAGQYWKMRQNLFVECFRAGLTDQEAVTVVFNARVATELTFLPDGVEQLWKEAVKPREQVAAEHGTGFEAPPLEERPSLAVEKRKTIALLDETERSWVAKQEWWGTRYLDWAATRVAMMNRPYHRMNLWTILSLRFSAIGYIPKKKGPLNLALFMFVLGKTTTGKTEAFDIMRSVIKACFPKEDQPFIGGDASPNALINKLIERDGKASLFNADEAHGLFAEMQNATWRGGLIEKWTDLYEGRVPMVLRNGQKDLSGVDATAFFIMHLMGTIDGMMKVLDADMWGSGFLARFIWAIGEEMEVTEDSLTEDQQEGDVVRAYEAMPKQWAAEFAAAEQRLKSQGALPLPILMNDEALARHTRLKIEMSRMFKGHRQEELIIPTLRRFANSVRKCASLVAMSEGAATVDLRHELIAIEQAEEWLTNILTMIEQTTANAFSRAVDDVERFIASQRSREIRLERVYSHFKIEKQFTDKYIAQLVAEGRIEKRPAAGDSYTLKIKESGAVAA